MVALEKPNISPNSCTLIVFMVMCMYKSLNKKQNMENNPKAQVVERLKEAQNVLVTVSANPSVDQLSAAIGLTLLLNKLDKHATAVFSGAVPSTLEFLKPEETLEQNTDSLRDFIISLDKSKADKLRYKVEEDFVKIFITPYRTSLNEQDLNFSQGDFNVDVVVALGVDEREHIDQAIIAHGRILHDATVIGIMAGAMSVDVGGINWQDPSASSLCEMLVGISESFKGSMLDSQIATAFLTGIVAETERFSNEKTSPKVMTISAQLMGAGANQQLIATELSAPDVVDEVPDDLPSPDDEVFSEDATGYGEDEAEVEDDGVSLHVDHTKDDLGAMTKLDSPAPAYTGPQITQRNDEHQIHIDDQGILSQKNEYERLAGAVQDVQTKSRHALMHERVIEPLQSSDESDAVADSGATPEYNSYVAEPPQLGGTLTGSTDDEDEPIVDPLSDIPQSTFPEPEYSMPTLPSTQSPLVSVTDDAERSISPPEVPVTESLQLASDGETMMPEPSLGPQISQGETLADIEKSVEAYTGKEVHPADSSVVAGETVPDAEAARQEVLDALTAGGFNADRPEPLQATGAAYLDDSINGNQKPDEFTLPPIPEQPSDPKDNGTPPPPFVPPPLPMP